VASPARSSSADGERSASADDALAALLMRVHRVGGEVVVLNGPDEPGAAGSRRAAVDNRKALARRITEMRRGGMAEQAIAEVLNEEDVSPPVGSGRMWHAWSVREVGGAWPSRGPHRPARESRRERSPGGSSGRST
jgi:hypothetical protein